MWKRTTIAALIFLSGCFGDGLSKTLPVADLCKFPYSEWTGAGGSVPAAATWPKTSIFYYVYVRSFLDSNGDGFGDFAGLTSKIQYIKDLGADAVLLLPIQQNSWDHAGGYSTTDYSHVEDDYGGDAGWNTFIVAAHAAGLKVMIDLSLTHVSDSHPWFDTAKSNPCTAEFNYFQSMNGPTCSSLPRNVFDTGPAWTQPVANQSCFFSPYVPLPALNFRNPTVTESIISVGEQWIAKGADGYRLDSAPILGEWNPANPTVAEKGSALTHAFWKAFMQRVKIANPQAVTIAEVFSYSIADLIPYHNDGIDMTFDYPIYTGMIAAFLSGNKTNLASEVSQTVSARSSGGTIGGLFLGNHDVPGTLIAPYGRIADMLGGNLARIQGAAALLFGLPGTPIIYYGEELGMSGAFEYLGDPKMWSRNPMQWNATANRGFSSTTPWVPVSSDSSKNVASEDGVGGSLLSTYRGLIAVRKTSPALKTGDYQEIPTNSTSVYAFLRTSISPAEKVAVVINFGTGSGATLNFQSVGVSAASVNDRIFGTAMNAISSGNAAAYPLDATNMPPYGVRWLLVH